MSGAPFRDASLQSERSIKSAAEETRTIVLGTRTIWQNEAKNINDFKETGRK
jgi:hypothetical protein